MTLDHQFTYSEANSRLAELHANAAAERLARSAGRPGVARLGGTINVAATVRRWFAPSRRQPATDPALRPSGGR